MGILSPSTSSTKMQPLRRRASLMKRRVSMICSLKLLVQQGEWFQVQQLLHCGSCGAGCVPLESAAEHCSFGTACVSCRLVALCLSHFVCERCTTPVSCM